MGSILEQACRGGPCNHVFLQSLQSGAPLGPFLTDVDRRSDRCCYLLRGSSTDVNIMYRNTTLHISLYGTTSVRKLLERCARLSESLSTSVRKGIGGVPICRNARTMCKCRRRVWPPTRLEATDNLHKSSHQKDHWCSALTRATQQRTSV